MLTTFGLLAAVCGAAIAALFNTFVFNYSRSNPNNVLVRSDLLASITALVMTTLIVFSVAFLAAALFKVSASIPISFGGALLGFLGLSYLCWLIFGTRSPAATKTLQGKVPDAAT